MVVFRQTMQGCTLIFNQGCIRITVPYWSISVFTMLL